MDRWTEIELFVQVAETGSLSRAAEALNLSNASASRHLAALEERLDTVLEKGLEWDPRPAVCVVMAAGGYPGPFEKGHVISGLAKAALMPDLKVFHAGTKLEGEHVVTDGGRVLGVTALGDTLEEARKRAYEACAVISFREGFYRRDIGVKGLTTAS